VPLALWPGDQLWPFQITHYPPNLCKECAVELGQVIGDWWRCY
jgi:hypothetical protein